MFIEFEALEHDLACSDSDCCQMHKGHLLIQHTSEPIWGSQIRVGLGSRVVTVGMRSAHALSAAVVEAAEDDQPVAVQHHAVT